MAEHNMRQSITAAVFVFELCVRKRVWVHISLTPVYVHVCVSIFTPETLILTQKGSNESLFILTRTHSMQIFGEIPFVKPQNDT